MEQYLPKWLARLLFWRDRLGHSFVLGILFTVTGFWFALLAYAGSEFIRALGWWLLPLAAAIVLGVQLWSTHVRRKERGARQAIPWPYEVEAAQPHETEPVDIRAENITYLRRA